MAQLTLAILLNPRDPGGAENTRPVITDADFRRAQFAAAADDDDGRTFTLASAADGGTTGAIYKPGDNVIPVPYEVTTATELLKWLLDRYLEEQANSSSSVTVVQVTNRGLTSGNTVSKTYQVTIASDPSSAVLDPSNAVEPSFTFS